MSAEIPFTSSKKVNSFVFTLHDYTPLQVAQLTALDVKYIIFGFEICPDTGRPHLQGYLNLHKGKDKSARSLKKFIDIDEIHIKYATGDSLVNKGYCSKGEQTKTEWNELNIKGPNYGLNADVIEVGVRNKTNSESGSKGGAVIADLWATSLELAKQGKLGTYCMSRERRSINNNY